MNPGFVPIAATGPGKAPGSSLPVPVPRPSPGAAALVPTPAPQSLANFRPVAQPSSHDAHPNIGEPKITLERDGDRITKIKVQCVCGHIVEFCCLY
jgi:hypothetical protein